MKENARARKCKKKENKKFTYRLVSHTCYFTKNDIVLPDKF